MGFPTPFPEPDSPELQRFAVRSRSEIVGRLRALEELAVPLTTFVGADGSVGVVTLQGVDEAAGKLVFAGTVSDGLRERLLGAPLATFVGYDYASKVQFAVRPAAERSGGGGDQVFATPIPEQLHLLERRSAARMLLETAKAAICRIPVPGSATGWEALRVVNIDAGGIAILMYPNSFEPVVGQEINNCRLDLPGVGGTVVSVKVRHVGTPKGEQQARLCGCAFVYVSPALRPMIRRFMRGRQRRFTPDVLGSAV